MAGIFVLVAVVATSYIIVTVGAVMLELTGMEKDVARFQALSAYSGAGFTTRVSELVVRHPVRRRIASFLIILGNAGTAGLIASLVGSFATQTAVGLLRNVVLLILFAAAAAFLVRRFGQYFGDQIRRVLTARMTDQLVPTEELLLYGKGFGITRVALPDDSRMIGRKLRETGLRERNLQVLAIEAGTEVQPIPDPEWTFEPGNFLIVYGDLRKVQDAFGPDAVE